MKYHTFMHNFIARDGVVQLVGEGMGGGGVGCVLVGGSGMGGGRVGCGGWVVLVWVVLGKCWW